MNNSFKLAAVIALLSAMPAAAITLTFEGINDPYPSPNYSVGGYYGGGTSGNGHVGPNYGIQFGDNALALCFNTLSRVCSAASRGGQGDPASADNGVFFRADDLATLTRQGGFTGAVSFF